MLFAFGGVGSLGWALGGAVSLAHELEETAAQGDAIVMCGASRQPATRGIERLTQLATDAALSPAVLMECLYYASDPALLPLIRLVAALRPENHAQAEEQLRPLLRDIGWHKH
jgi:hypothetical protein